MAKGVKTGGRQAGTPNKVTAQGRAAFRDMLNNLGPKVQRWIIRTAKTDPGTAARLTLQLAEFCVPRWQRITVDLSKMPLEDIAGELARREAEAAVLSPDGSSETDA